MQLKQRQALQAATGVTEAQNCTRCFASPLETLPTTTLDGELINNAFNHCHCRPDSPSRSSDVPHTETNSQQTACALRKDTIKCFGACIVLQLVPCHTQCSFSHSNSGHEVQLRHTLPTNASLAAH